MDYTRKEGRVAKGGVRHTGNCAMMDWNCGGESTPESRRYSSSVRQVERERLIAAVSGMLEDDIGVEKGLVVRQIAKSIED